MSVWSLKKKGFLRSKIADLNRRRRRPGEVGKKDAMSSIGLRFSGRRKTPVQFAPVEFLG
jgi:hypothetical protein